MSFCAGKFADGDSECEKSVYIRQHVYFIYSLVNALYTLCLKKTSHLWLAITLTHMNGFGYFWQKCTR